MRDLAVLGQDPALRRRRARPAGGVPGGARAARALDRAPLRPASDPRRAGGSPSTGSRPCRQLRAGAPARARELAGARSVWVATPLATHGYAAARAGRRYGCWVGTSLEDEWSGRARGLDPLRRLAQRLNAPPLRRLERAVLRGATRVYATSPASRAAVAAAGGMPEGEVAILPIPVDVEALAPEPDEAWQARLARADARLRRPRRRPAQEPAAAARRRCR